MASPISIPVNTSSSQLWSGRNTTAINTLLLINTDLTNTVMVGSSLQSIVVPIPPNGSLSVDPVENWYAQGLVPGQSPVVVVPNGQSTFRGLSQGAGKLALPQFQSPNYVPGSVGWAVFENGFAEFSNVIVRGTITASQFIGTGGGEEILIYSGTPAAGNLIMAMVSASFTDTFGNQGFAGLNILTPFTAGQARLLNIPGGAGQNAGIRWFFSVTGQNTWQTGASITPQVATQLLGKFDVMSLVPVTGGTVPGFNSPTGIAIGQWSQLPAQVSAPASVAGNAVTFASALSALHVIDGTDGVNYSTERMTQVLGSNTGSLVALTTVFAQAAGVRTYRITCNVLVDVAVANAQVSCAVIDTAGTATGRVDITVVRAATFFGCTAGNVNATNSVLINLPNANGYIVKLNATVTVLTAGTISVQFGSATAQAIVLEQYSTMEYMPS